MLAPSCAYRSLNRKLHGTAAGFPFDAPLPHDDIAADDRSRGPALHVHAVIGRPAAAAFDPMIGNGAFGLEVNNGEIGIEAHSDASLAGDLEQPGRTIAGQIDQALDAETALRHMIEHDRHER